MASPHKETSPRDENYFSNHLTAFLPIQRSSLDESMLEKDPVQMVIAEQTDLIKDKQRRHRDRKQGILRSP